MDDVGVVTGRMEDNLDSGHSVPVLVFSERHAVILEERLRHFPCHRVISLHVLSGIAVLKIIDLMIYRMNGNRTDKLVRHDNLALESVAVSRELHDADLGLRTVLIDGDEKVVFVKPCHRVDVAVTGVERALGNCRHLFCGKVNLSEIAP